MAIILCTSSHIMTVPMLPLEIIGLIAENFTTPSLLAPRAEWSSNRRALLNLAITSRTIHSFLEPLLYRSYVVECPADLVTVFVHLLKRPRARKLARSIRCCTRMTRGSAKDAARDRWATLSPLSDTEIRREIVKEKLNPWWWKLPSQDGLEDSPVWEAFEHDDCLDMILTGVLCLTPELETFSFNQIGVSMWQDMASNLDIIAKARRGQPPPLGRLQALRYHLDSSSEWQKLTRPLFDGRFSNSLRQVVLEMDLFKFEVLVESVALENQPIEELYLGPRIGKQSSAPRQEWVRGAWTTEAPRQGESWSEANARVSVYTRAYREQLVRKTAGLRKLRVLDIICDPPAEEPSWVLNALVRSRGAPFEEFRIEGYPFFVDLPNRLSGG